MGKSLYPFLFFITSLFTSCTKLESTDFYLTENCQAYQKELTDSLTFLKMKGLHYISMDTDRCILTVKYENKKVSPDFFTHYLAERHYNLQLENIETFENDEVLEFE